MVIAKDFLLRFLKYSPRMYKISQIHTDCIFVLVAQ